MSSLSRTLNRGRYSLMRLFSRMSDCASDGDDDRLDIGDQALEQAILRTGVEIRGEVAADPLLQALGLAHVQHVPRRALPQVDAGALGERVELALKRVGNAWCRHERCRWLTRRPARGSRGGGGASPPGLRYAETVGDQKIHPSVDGQEQHGAARSARGRASPAGRPKAVPAAAAPRPRAARRAPPAGRSRRSGG